MQEEKIYEMEEKMKMNKKDLQVKLVSYRKPIDDK